MDWLFRMKMTRKQIETRKKKKRHNQEIRKERSRKRIELEHRILEAIEKDRNDIDESNKPRFETPKDDVFLFVNKLINEHELSFLNLFHNPHRRATVEIQRHDQDR